MKLFPGENIIDLLSLQEKEQNIDLILITNKGSFVKYASQEITISKKGELGTMAIDFKDNKKIKDRVINCFVNNKYVFIETDKGRYEKLQTDQLDSSLYKKQKQLNIKLNNDDFIKSTFSTKIPKND